jgi:predicted ArsR family transcriptional regulator
MPRFAFRAADPRPRSLGTPPDQGLSLFDPGQRHSNAAKRKSDRRRALTWFVAHQRGSADDCAEGLGMDVLAIRPRCTELVQAGLLEKLAGSRRRTRHGGSAGVLQISEAGESEWRRGAR